MSQRTCLLDTNILLTATIAPERLPQEVQGWLSDPGNTVFFSCQHLGNWHQAFIESGEF